MVRQLKWPSDWWNLGTFGRILAFVRPICGSGEHPSRATNSSQLYLQNRLCPLCSSSAAQESNVVIVSGNCEYQVL